MSMLSTIAQIVGLAFEVAGVWLMASQFFPAKSVLITIKILISASVRGRYADSVERNPGIIMSNDNLVSVQGLVFILIGFIIQLIAILISQVIKIIDKVPASEQVLMQTLQIYTT